MPEYHIYAVGADKKARLVLKVDAEDELQAVDAARKVDCDAPRVEVWHGRRFVENVWRD